MERNVFESENRAVVYLDLLGFAALVEASPKHFKEGTATVIDEIIDLHDRITGKMFNAAKHKHQEQFQSSGKGINDKVRLYGRIGQALIEAKRLGADPFAAIESVLPWGSFCVQCE